MEKKEGVSTITTPTLIFERYNYLFTSVGLLSSFVILGPQLITTLLTGYVAFKYGFQMLQTVFLFMTSSLLFGYWFTVFNMFLTMLHVLVYKRELFNYYRRYLLETELCIKNYERLSKFKDSLGLFQENKYYYQLQTLYEKYHDRFVFLSEYLERINNLIKSVFEYVYGMLEPHIFTNFEHPVRTETDDQQTKEIRHADLQGLKDLLCEDSFNIKEKNRFNQDQVNPFKDLQDFSKLPNFPTDMNNGNMPTFSKEQLMKEMNEFKELMTQLESVKNMYDQ